MWYIEDVFYNYSEFAKYLNDVKFDKFFSKEFLLKELPLSKFCCGKSIEHLEHTAILYLRNDENNRYCQINFVKEHYYVVDKDFNILSFGKVHIDTIRKYLVKHKKHIIGVVYKNKKLLKFIKVSKNDLSLLKCISKPSFCIKRPPATCFWANLYKGDHFKYFFETGGLFQRIIEDKKYNDLTLIFYKKDCLFIPSNIILPFGLNVCYKYRINDMKKFDSLVSKYLLLSRGV